MNYLLLGRHGDLMQILPALKWESERSCEPQSIICSREFAPFLDGVTYAEATPYDGHWDDVKGALAWALKEFPDDYLKNCSIYGKGWHYTRSAPNYQHEIWRNTGNPYALNCLPLEFDNRDYSRECDLILEFKDLVVRPYVVVHFGGVSSPFPHAEIVLNAIRHWRPDLAIVDITNHRAHRLYDYLGLLEQSQGLICSDSSILHLGRAVLHLDTIAFITDGHKPWNRSEPHAGVIWDCLYSEVEKRRNELITPLLAL